MPTQVIGIAGVNVFSRNPGRLSLTMRNASTGGQIIYFALRDNKGLTIAEADYVLNVNEEKNFTWDTDGEDMRNPVAAISSAAGGALYAAETSVRRGS